MAYDEHLADRLRTVLQHRNVEFYEKKMFGGLCYLVDDKMCIGIVKEELMARVGPDNAPQAMEKPGVRDMDFTGRPMKGYIFVTPEGMDTEEDLEYFVDLSLQFNPFAKAFKKKKIVNLGKQSNVK